MCLSRSCDICVSPVSHTYMGERNEPSSPDKPPPSSAHALASVRDRSRSAATKVFWISSCDGMGLVSRDGVRDGMRVEMLSTDEGTAVRLAAFCGKGFSNGDGDVCRNGGEHDKRKERWSMQS